MELKLIHDYIIKPRLRSTPGLAEVNAQGGYERQIVVQPNPEQLKSVGISFSELTEVIGETWKMRAAASLNWRGKGHGARRGPRANAEEIADIALRLAEEQPRGMFETWRRWVSAKPSARGLQPITARNRFWARRLCFPVNSRIVAKRVADKLREIQAKLPQGVSIIPVYDRTVLVDRTIRTVETSLFEGAILVVVILLLMLGNWRAALIVALPFRFPSLLPSPAWCKAAFPETS